MAVIVQYIVERNGVQKMTFTDKKEADQYDKMLDIAESLYDFIGAADLPLSDESLEPLSLFLAENSMEIANLLKGSKPKKSKATTKDDDKAKTDSDSEKSSDDSMSTPEAELVEDNNEQQALNNQDETAAA